MGFIKSILDFERNGQRVTPYGTIMFNANGVCNIPDDELAKKVADSSPSLVLADESDENVQKILAELKRQEAKGIAEADQSSVGAFMESANAGGVEVQSDALKSNSGKVIGNAAELEAHEAGGDGIFTPSKDIIIETAKEPENLIGSPASTEPATDNVIIESAEEVKEAPIASTPEPTQDELIASQFRTMEVSDIKDIMDASPLDSSKYEDVSDKEELIKIALDNKIMD